MRGKAECTGFMYVYCGTRGVLDSKEVKPVNLKGNQPWILIGRTNAEAPVFWSPEANSLLIGKVPEAGKDWRQKGKNVSEDEMGRWHHRCDGHELGQTSEDGEGQGSLASCSPWGRTELNMTGWLNNILYYVSLYYFIYLYVPYIIIIVYCILYII